VLVLGGGVVGANAARIAAGVGANVTLMDVSLDRLRYLADVMPANVTTIYSDPFAIAEYAAQADLVIGAVLIPGARAPSLINRATLKQMKAGAVIVDVAIDQGGCVETSRPTTHKEPTYLVEGVVHYCVTNMPGAVGRTSTQALCHATQPYVVKLACAAEQGSTGIDALVAGDASFASALNLREGRIVHPAVAAAMAG
jgi:alanine dehydrogenase